MTGLSFGDLRDANSARQYEWPGNEQADLAFRVIEVAGEAGEVLEAVKKLLRAERGIRGSIATVEDVASEMADNIIALDLLANELGVDLAAAVVRKFNATSEKYRLETRLDPSAGEEAGVHPDDLAVDRFAVAMKAKLAKKRAEGRGGWDDREQCTGAFLSQLLVEHVEKGDPLDVGNLAMMLHQRGERISDERERYAETRKLTLPSDGGEK